MGAQVLHRLVTESVEFRGRNGTGEEVTWRAPRFVEESHYDTVAVAVVNAGLYVACNYKTRQMAEQGIGKRSRGKLVKNQ